MSIVPKTSLVPLHGRSHPYPQATANLLPVSIDLPFLHMSYKWNRAIICGLLWLAFPTCSRSWRFMSQHRSAHLSFSLLSVTPFFGYTFCFSVHQLTDIWIVSGSRPWWVMLLWALTDKSLCDYVFSFLWGRFLGAELLVLIKKKVCVELFRNCQAVF